MSKKYLLLTIFAISSLELITSDISGQTSAGKGFYVELQGGGGKIDVSLKPTNPNSNLTLKDKSWTKMVPSLQFNWGYSHRFDSDVTLGFEATVISPGLRLGYMMNDRHHIAIGVHMPVFLLGILKDFNKNRDELLGAIPTDLMSEKDKKNFPNTIDSASAIGVSFSYEYFTEAKNFYRIQVRNDFYRADGKIGQDVLYSNGKSYHQIDVKGSINDLYVSVGIGTQW